MQRIYDFYYYFFIIIIIFNQSKALTATFFLRGMLEILMLGKQVQRK